jgi:ribonuclease-3
MPKHFLQMEDGAAASQIVYRECVAECMKRATWRNDVELSAKQLHIGRYLRLGRGEEKSGGRSKVALQVDALEALLAALYLDADLETARSFILERIVEPELRRLKKQVAEGLPITDYKSALQEAAHSAERPQPAYVLVKEEGPEHKKTFTVEARLHGTHGHRTEYVGRGEGTTKKTAEQDAAKEALEYLWSLDDGKAAPPHSARPAKRK